MSETENVDLFGHPDPIGAAIMEVRRKRNWYKANGYARVPGSGPAGETCQTCAECCASGTGRKTFYKCGVIRHRWTHGRGTDILLGSAACSMWKKEESHG